MMGVFSFDQSCISGRCLLEKKIWDVVQGNEERAGGCQGRKYGGGLKKESKDIRKDIRKDLF